MVLSDAEKKDVEDRFRPIFNPYEEEGGVPLDLLNTKLKDSTLIKDIPKDKITQILRKADKNKDGRLSYEEFFNLLNSDDSGLNTKEFGRARRLLRATVGTVIPKNSKKEDLESFTEAYNCCPPPLFMPIVSLIELIIFIVYAVELQNNGTPITAKGGVAVYSPLIYNPYRRYEAWRYVTYMFIHNGYFHIAFNILIQLLFGLPLELVNKFWRVGIVYLLGVLAGSLAHSVFEAHVYLCGASGGVYAILGAHFASIIMNWEEMQHDYMSGPIKFLSSAPFRIIVLILLIGLDTGVAIYERVESGSTAVGIVAHAGGFLAGLLMGIPVLRNLDKKDWEEYVFWVAVIVYSLFMSFAILWNTFYPGFPAFNMTPCCSMDNTVEPS